MKTLTNEEAEAIEQSLNGTCQSVDDAAQALDLDPEAALNSIGERGNIDCCTRCGWWDEMSALSCPGGADLVCVDCLEPGEREE